MNIHKLIEFYKISKNRNKSRDNYFKFHKFQANLIISNILKKINIPNSLHTDIRSHLSK